MALMDIRRENAFDVPEFAARREKTRTLMAKRGIDTLVLHSAPNIYYLCGHHTLNLWDYQCLVLPMEGQPFMLLWHFEEGRFAATAVDTALELFGSGDEPIAETRDVLQKYGLRKGMIGIEKECNFLSPGQCERLSTALEPARVVDASGVVEQVRMVKSDAELDLIRRSARGTDSAMRAGYSEIREGVRDTEIAAAVVADLVRSDTQGFSIYPMVAVGYRSGIPHHSHDGIHVARGDIVFLEFAPAIHWYNAPLMRSAALGDPPAFVETVADTGSAALQAMFETMRAGIPASDVAAAGKAEVDRIRDRIHFHDFFAYSVGIGFPPTWLEGGFGIVMNNHRPLEAGMVFHFPMTLRVKGEFGVGQSQTVIVRDDGAEVLSELPLGLHRVEG